jgi:pimeloyl-ACP methyl ester carboxylesterase
LPFTEHFVEIDGCRTHFRRGGSGAPLVFLHGAGGVFGVLPFMARLAERFDVIVPDHPGYGKSDEPAWLENIHDLAYFYLDFLARLGLEKVLLAGASMGGWMALELAVRNASRLQALVLNAPAGVAAPGIEPADVFLLSPEEGVRTLVHDQSIADRKLAAPPPPEALDLVLKNRHTTARLAWEPRFHDPHLPKWLHRIDVPVHLVWGAQDRVLPLGIGHELKRIMPKAELHVLEGCGHLPQEEKVDEYCDIVFRFA